MAYCFDTSAFLECWTRYYPPDIFPGLWDKLSDLAAYKQIVAPEEVRRELEKQEDDLTLWVQQRPHIFVPLDSAVQTSVREVLARHPFLVKATSNRNQADPFVIAVARAQGLTVVTEEKGGTPTKPKIPSVCQDFNVRCVGVVQFIRDQGWTFS